MHQILDLWSHQWRRHRARGRIVIVRYADDFIMDFESKADTVHREAQDGRKRLTPKLTALRQEVWRFMHAPLATQHERFAAVLRGHYAYYAGRTTIQRLTASTAKCVGTGCAV